LREDADDSSPLGGSLLIVDDDENYRRIVELQLLALGCTCISARTHEETIQIVENNDRIRFVLLDYSVYGIGPSSVAQKIKSLRPDVRIVGHSTLNRRREFLEMGVPLFLRKPLITDDLVRLLNDTHAN